MYHAQLITYLLIIVPYILSPFYVFVTFYFGGSSFKKSISIAVGVLLWALVMFSIAYYDLLRYVGEYRSHVVILSVLIPVIFTYLYRAKLLNTLTSQWFLVGIQVFRSIGIVFIIEMYAGNLPTIFSIPAGYGDLFVSLFAILTLLVGIYYKKFPSALITALAVVGTIDFISAIFFGVTSSPGPLQLFSFDKLNSIYLFPTALIPLFFVPLAASYHVLSLALLKNMRLNANK